MCKILPDKTEYNSMLDDSVQLQSWGTMQKYCPFLLKHIFYALFKLQCPGLEMSTTAQKCIIHSQFCLQKIIFSEYAVTHWTKF